MKMSNIGNKETMSKNLKYYIAQSGKDRRELCAIWGFPYSTVTDWINGNKYPRIDRIEIMAEYFGILKSDLIEERTEEHREMQIKNDTLASVVVRLRTDEKFLSSVMALYKLDDEKLDKVESLLQVL